MKSDRVAFTLLENARAFLDSAVKYVRGRDPEERRFAILHLVTALELLLKAKIAADDPALLVVGGKQASDEQFARGEFRSIGMERAIELLTLSGRVVVTDRQAKQLTTLRSMRNRVTHFVSTANETETRAALGAGFHLFIELHNAQFQDDDVYRAKAMGAIAEELNEFDEFVRERLEQLSSQLRAAERPRTRHLEECRACLQDATVISGDYLECLFCGWRDFIAKCAASISHGHPVEQCPLCGRSSVAYHRWKTEEPTYECFCCGYFLGPELRWSDGKNPIPRLRF